MNSGCRRPDHPDFWLISQALLDQDAQSDGGQDAEEILARMINPESARYAAIQRASRVNNTDPGALAQLAGTWIDGFLAGMTVQRLKDRNTRQPQLSWAPYQESGIPDPAAETWEPPDGPVTIGAHGYRGNDIIIYWIAAEEKQP